MILKRLKTLFTKQAENLAGNDLPAMPKKLDQCYAELDTTNWWQGDLYPLTVFPINSFPNDSIPYWMLINRTCHLYSGGSRKTKIPFLNYAAVYPLKAHVGELTNKGGIKNGISDLIQGKLEGFVFLPANDKHLIASPLVINFNILYTLPTDKCPQPSTKCIQLASPFCEHIFQKFSRYFYTVGYDDGSLRDKEYITKLVRQFEAIS